MELADYLRILRRRWRLIVTTVLLVVVAAALITWRTTPQYQSSTQLFISTSASSSAEAYQGNLFSSQRLASYADLATGTELATRVVSTTGSELSPGDLAAKVTAQASPDTVLLTISVTDPDPEVAQQLTQAYGDELVALVAELETPPGQNKPVLKGTIVDAASLPGGPVSPNVLRNLALATILGLLLGVGLAVVRELLDTSTKSADDVTSTLEAPILGTFAFDPEVGKRPLLTDLSSHEPRAEAYRVLRTNLSFVDIDAESKAIVITSSLPGEGKSTTSVNIALALHAAGERTLLIDGDLRRPQAAALLNLDPSIGLTTALVGKVTVSDVILTHASGLHVLASGTVPPNPAELLQSQAMAGILAELRAAYDVIVIDAPPLLPVTDAALIASQVDGAVLVVRHGRTTREQLAGARERLAAVGANTLGAVFNMVPRKGRGNYGSGYGYGYGYGYAPDEVPVAEPESQKA
ncbi:polysaccharide biosynthesis tyrosine autokinase [Nocardioides sp.]|uniref:polysaccharide biosynthesis tyrosine autokinase n=1 Tax=Nocardioides sp. TaxID=35761 RepID=UPI0035AFFA63